MERLLKNADTMEARGLRRPGILPWVVEMTLLGPASGPETTVG
jgi:hypothetical protein